VKIALLASAGLFLNLGIFEASSITGAVLDRGELRSRST